MNAIELQDRMRNVRLLALDVDGVLTDGGVYIGDDGHEFRRFDIKDGLGLKQVMEHGINVALISSASCNAVRHRAKMLGIREVHLNVVNKMTVLSELCIRLKVKLNEVCYIGDDLVDLEIIRSVDLACAPADAVTIIRQAVTYITQASGGRGAVREVCDLLLKSMD